MATNEAKEFIPTNYMGQLVLIILGIIGNLFLGAISVYTSRLQSNLDEIEGIARTSATNASLIARDVDNLTKWSVEEIREIKNRVRRIEDRK